MRHKSMSARERAYGQRERKKCGHSRANGKERKLTIGKIARLMKRLALVRLAGVARAARLLDIALFKRDADPSQGQSDQRVAHHY
jgi:hypothetical protein